MSIEPLSANGRSITEVRGAMPMSMASPPPTRELDGTLQGVSQQLGMSLSSVQSALRQGQSIDDLAKQQGVSRDAIAQSVEARVQQRRHAAGQPPLDRAVLERMVKRALEHHRRHGAAGIVSVRAASTPASAAERSPAPAGASPGGGISVTA